MKFSCAGSRRGSGARPRPEGTAEPEEVSEGEVAPEPSLVPMTMDPPELEPLPPLKTEPPELWPLPEAP